MLQCESVLFCTVYSKCMTSTASSIYICVISICAPLEQTAEEICSRRDFGKPSSKLIFDTGQSSGLLSICVLDEVNTLPSIFKGF